MLSEDHRLKLKQDQGSPWCLFRHLEEVDHQEVTPLKELKLKSIDLLGKKVAEVSHNSSHLEGKKTSDSLKKSFESKN